MTRQRLLLIYPPSGLCDCGKGKIKPFIYNFGGFQKIIKIMLTFNDLSKSKQDTISQAMLFVFLANPKIGDPNKYLDKWLVKKTWKSKKKVRDFIYWKLREIQKIKEKMKTTAE